MQTSIDEMYRRVGRHLEPTIRKDVVLDNNGKVKYRVTPGHCARTHLSGPVVPYQKSEHGTVPTLAKLLWMFSYQTIPKSDGTPYRQRIGGAKNRIIVLTKKRVLTNVAFEAPIPALDIIELPEIMRRLTGQTDFLSLAFGKNTDLTLGDQLHHRFDDVEVNGELDLALCASPIPVSR